MTSPTLVQSALLCQDMLQRGVIESTILTDRFFEILPMKAVSGNAYAYNRENVIGDSQGLDVGGTITATAAATVTQVSTSLKTLIGQTEVNKMIQATRSNINDQVGYQIASKAKSVGNLFRSYLINGVSSTTQFDGLLTLVDAGKTVSATGTDGDVLSFAKLDELLDQVTDKDGKVDYIMMNPREIRAYKALCRALGGAAITESVSMPVGPQMIAYNGVPIFANDNLLKTQTQGSSTNASSIIAGTLDDGSGMVGISGLTAENAAGMMVEDVGTHQSKDEHIYRIKWYSSVALFNLNGLAVATGIIP